MNRLGSTFIHLSTGAGNGLATGMGDGVSNGMSSSLNQAGLWRTDF